MPKDPAVVGFDELVSVAERLNTASDALTASFRTIETKVNALGLGIQRFVSILDTREWNPEAGKLSIREWDEQQLGYARIGDGWGFVIRAAHFHDDGDEEAWQFGEEKPLLRAPRAIRIQAAAALPGLFRELKREADQVLAVVEAAHQLATSADEAVPGEGSAADLRFFAFVRSTDADDRNRAAFERFEDFIDAVARSGMRPFAYHSQSAALGEFQMLRLAVSEMFYRVLPKVGFKTLLASGYGIGSAIRYGVLRPSGDALNGVEDAAGLNELASRGWDAEIDATRSQTKDSD